MTRMLPGQTLDSDIELDLIIGAKWKLTEQSDHPWRLIVVYRGLHCPICKSQLKSLSGQLTNFTDAGITVVAASMDTAERAKKAHSDWELGDLPLAYGLSEDLAQRFGLYMSNAIKESEADRFTEPAIIAFKGDAFKAIWLQSVPFARPKFEDVLSGLKFMEKNDYPARGGD